MTRVGKWLFSLLAALVLGVSTAHAKIIAPSLSTAPAVSAVTQTDGYDTQQDAAQSYPNLQPPPLVYVPESCVVAVRQPLPGDILLARDLLGRIWYMRIEYEEVHNGEFCYALSPYGLSILGDLAKLAVKSDVKAMNRAFVKAARKAAVDDFYKYSRGTLKDAGLAGDYQVHHLIIQNLFDKGDVMAKWLNDMGVMKDAAKNCVVLPTTAAKGLGRIVTEATAHSGGHSGKYIKEVTDPLQDIFRRQVSGEISKETAQTLLSDIQGSIRKRLLKGELAIGLEGTASKSKWAKEIFTTALVMSLATGVSQTEAEETAEKALKKAMDNETYYRVNNAIIKYGNAGYYSRNSGRAAQITTTIIDLINPIQDIQIIGDLADDAGDLWGKFGDE